MGRAYAADRAAPVSRRVLAAIQPELEREVDEMILAQPAHERPLLMKHRETLIRELARTTEIANLRHRLAQAEERLKPRLVE
jgi:hypothetical protein